MDIQTLLDNAMTASRVEKLKTSPQLTLIEIILKLEMIENKTHTVSFDFENAFPTELDSWRGSYDELALGFSFEGYEPTIEDFIKTLKESIGKEYTGYKGGDFVMSKNTPVWVANYGHCGSTAIINVLDTGYGAVLETKYLPY